MTPIEIAIIEHQIKMLPTLSLDRFDLVDILANRGSWKNSGDIEFKLNVKRCASVEYTVRKLRARKSQVE